MRILRINNKKVYIDNATAIGIDYQTYDIKQPAQPKINITNTFNIPAVTENLEIFGFVNNPQSLNTNSYGFLLCDYWVGNEQILKQAKVRLESITENRINLFIYEKFDFWDELKKYEWQDFATELLTWLQDVKGYESITSPTSGNIISSSGIITNTEGIFLPYYISNLEKDTTDYNYIDLGDSLENSGHLCVYAKTIFEFLEYKYSVNFGTAGSLFSGNLWDDAVAKALYTPIRDIAVKTTTPAYFYISTAPYAPYSEELKDKGSKTVYDYVTAFFKHVNVLISYLTISNVDYIALRRFDDIESIAPVEDFSSRISKITSFKNRIDSYGQNNRIKFKTVFAENNEFSNSKVLTTDNVNINVNVDLFEIDAYVNGIVQNDTGQAIANLSDEDAIKEMSFLISGDLTDNVISVGTAPIPPSIDAITQNFSNVDLDTFTSSSSGAVNVGSSDTVNTYAKSENKSVLAGNYIDLSWNYTSGDIDFAINIYDVTNGVTLDIIAIIGGSLQYTMLIDTVIQIRIARVSGAPISTSFSITNLSGLIYDYQPSTNNSKLYIANLYDLSSEYNFLDEIITTPKIYEIEKWLTVADIRNLDFFTQFYIKQLGASFFINKIKGFNPERSLEPTTLELIKISDKTPSNTTFLNEFVDGVNDPFTGSIGDIFY